MMRILLFHFQLNWSLLERDAEEGPYSIRWVELSVLELFTSSVPRAPGRQPGLNVYFWMVTIYHGNAPADVVLMDSWVEANRCLLRWVNRELLVQPLFCLAQVHSDALLEDWGLLLRLASAGTRRSLKRACRLSGLPRASEQSKGEWGRKKVPFKVLITLIFHDISLVSGICGNCVWSGSMAGVPLSNRPLHWREPASLNAPLYRWRESRSFLQRFQLSHCP